MSFEIGDAVPSFTLPDTAGVEHALPLDPAPEATVVIQMCHHCPSVRAWNARVKPLAEDYTQRGDRLLVTTPHDTDRCPPDPFRPTVPLAPPAT